MRESFSQWHQLSGDTQYARVRWIKVVWAPATPQLGFNHAIISNIGNTICFTYIVITKLFGNKYLILFFVALAHNTTGVTTATTMAVAGGNAPLAPHMRSCAQHRRVKWIGNDPPSLRMYFLGGLRMFMALKLLLAMMHHRKIGVFWGPCTPQQPPKLCTLAWGVIAHSFDVSVRSKRSRVGR